MKALTITLTDENQLKVTASEPLDPSTLVDMSLSACLAMMSSIVDEAQEDDKQKVKEYLFDLFNISASALLAQFAPDIDLRPDLTEEAILIKEMELANDKLSNM